MVMFTQKIVYPITVYDITADVIFSIIKIKYIQVFCEHQESNEYYTKILANKLKLESYSVERIVSA